MEEVAKHIHIPILRFNDGSVLTQEWNGDLKRWEGYVRHPDGTECALAFPRRWPIHEILRMSCEHSPEINDGQGGKMRASFQLWSLIDRGEWNPEDPFGEFAPETVATQLGG